MLVYIGSCGVFVVTMFSAIVSSTIALAAYLAYRERIKYPRVSEEEVQNTLRSISRLITFEKWEEAEKELAVLLDKGLGGKEGLLLHAQVLCGTKKYEQALHLVIDASRIYPEELHFRQEEGKILLKMDYPQDALEAFKVCAPILRSETDLYFVAQAYLQAGYLEHCFGLLFCGSGLLASRLFGTLFRDSRWIHLRNAKRKSPHAGRRGPF